jgi:hypothetical protein
MHFFHLEIFHMQIVAVSELCQYIHRNDSARPSPWGAECSLRHGAAHRSSQTTTTATAKGHHWSIMYLNKILQLRHVLTSFRSTSYKRFYIFVLSCFRRVYFGLSFIIHINLLKPSGNFTYRQV